MRGDFVLYRAKGGDPFEWLISTVTKGPFIHSEIDMGDGTYIGEHGKGITRHPADYGRVKEGSAVLVTPRGDLELGLKWVEAMWREAVANHETHEYGYLDLVTDAARAFSPRYIILRLKPNDWDCSDFVTRYLNMAHAAGPLGALAANPEIVSPNDLARAFHVK